MKPLVLATWKHGSQVSFFLLVTNFYLYQGENILLGIILYGIISERKKESRANAK